MLRLRRMFDVKGIPVNLGAAALGMSEKTLYNKLTGASEFTYGEARTVKRLFPEYDLDYLLSEEPDAADRKEA